MIASEEQNIIIKTIEENNIVVDSVAGSGKTTTNIFIAKEYPYKKILLLTFNRKLSDETKERLEKENITNLEVYTYHGFCNQNYIETHDDKGMLQSLDLKCKILLDYDIIIIDEAQDINELYYKFICKILFENSKEYNLCILGDKNQSIYEFMGADNRYLTMAEQIFNFNDKKWTKLKLSTSYRMTKQIAEFMNNCILNEKRIISIKEGIKPEYYIINLFKDLINIVQNIILREHIKPEEIFILAPSVKGKKTDNDTPLTILENYLVNHNIDIYIPTNDDEKISENETKNKLVFSSFHQSKGLERKVVICYGFDTSYYEFYGKNLSFEYCPNVLYVALTRAKERLIIIQDENKNIMPFINTKNMDEYSNSYKSDNKKNNNCEFKNKNTNTNVTDFVRFLSQEFMTNILNNYIEEIEIIKPTREIKINNTLKFISNGKEITESVSEINGTMIPMYYEYLTNKKIQVIEILKNIPDDENIFKKDIRFIDDVNNDNLQIKDMLKIANYFNCYQTKYIHKIKQIKNYNWITEEQITKCVNRMKKIIKSKAQYEIHVSKNNYINNKKLVGFIDCIDNKNIYEFKFVNKIKDEHKIQLCIYIYLFCLNNKIKSDDEMNKYKFFLFNIKNNNLIQFKTTFENICKFYDDIVYYKTNEFKIKSNEEFLNQCKNAIIKYINIKESRYEFKEIQRKNNTIKIKEIFIKKINNTMMKYADIKKLYDATLNKGYKPNQIIIKGANIDSNYKTLKARDEENLKNWDEDEYYEGKVINKEKFDSFYSYTIYIL